MSRFAGLFVLGMLIAVGSLSGQDAKKASSKVEGEWKPTEFKEDGKEGNIADDMRMIFKDDTFLVREGDQVHVKGTFKVNAARKPHEIDMEFTEGPENFQGKTGKGIYAIDGNTLKIALKAPGLDERPKEFASAEGSKIFLLVLERVKK
jgi:uncharacterized protein (TIGR03067 family)